MKQDALHTYALPATSRKAIPRWVRRFVLIFLFATTINSCFGQTTFFTETFGTGTTLPTGWTVNPTTPTTDWTAATTNPSTSTYTGSSGGTNAFFTPNGVTTSILTSASISTSGYSNISVMWGGRYVALSPPSYTINLVLSWSVNGSTWTDVSFTNVPVSTTGVWGLVNNSTRIALPAGAANISTLQLRFTATASSSLATGTNVVYRIDDLTVAGCPVAGTISYAGTPYCKSITTAQAVTPPTVTGGTYSSTAGLSLNATTGAITPSTSTAGTYTVTYTTACGATTSTTVVISDLPTVSSTPTETCVGGSTGTITVNASGGASPYTYNLNSGTYQASSLFSGLAAGAYTVSAKTSTGCVTSASVTVIRSPNSTDDQNITATDSWIGHMYDGMNFTDYIGRFTEPESLNELFGGNTVCFPVTTNVGNRSIYTETFSTKFLMNSTKKGLYTVNLGADDGHRLTIDGALMYNRWSDAAYTVKSNVLMKLTGSSSLMYEFYENGGANQVSYQGLTLLLANTLTTNTTQTICLGNASGLAISGDAFGTLPTGIALSGTGYQWSYSTTPGGTRTDLTGATLATYTPLTTAAPFSTPGTYYLYRTATLVSTNNTGFATYTAALLSNVATITTVPNPTATISYSGTPFCTNAGAIAVSRNGSSGGSFSSTTGLSIDASTGTITTGSSTPGNYTVTYTIAATLLCSAFSTTTSVTITALPAATISYPNSLYCSDAGTATITMSGSSGGTYSSTAGLSISGSNGSVNLATSTAGDYTVSYTIPASGGCPVVTATTPFSVKTAGIWTGATSNDFGTGSNWLCGSIPLATTNVVIPAGLSVYPIVTGTNTVPNISIASGASVTVNGTLQITGTITSSGKFTAKNGTVEFNGSAAQQIPVGLFDSALVKNLTINNTAGVTLSDSLKLTGILKIAAGQFNTGDKLVLKSTATANAMVATITSAATTPINGKVTAERYVQGRRKYRLMTSPVTTSTATTLAAGQESLSIWGTWQNGGNNTVGNTGTFITGGSGADGFDPQTTNASLFTYDDVNRQYKGFTTANGKNTKYTPLVAGTAYYMFVYGDRVNTIITSTPNNTVLSSTGTLLTGDQAYTTASAMPLSPVVGRYTLLGNPFASAINWATIPKTNLDNAYWGWDPNLSSTGGYITVMTSGTVTLQAPFTGTTGLNQYIQPGQGFFVKTTAASPTLTIREQDKVTNFNANAFRTGSVDSMPLLAINLFYSNGLTQVLTDGVLAAFDNSLAATGGGSATKIANNNENIALVKDSVLQSIQTRPLPGNNDTIKLKVWRLTKPQYTFRIFAQQMPATGLQAYLYDKYLDSLQALSFTDTNNIAFDVIPGVPASSDSNRFRIVFRNVNSPLPVTFVSVAAQEMNRQVQVDWAVANESSIQQYLVEKATDWATFIRAATVASKGNATANNYRWMDAAPTTGNNYYRIRAVQKDGQSILSKTVLVKLGSTASPITIFPNPISGHQLTVRCNDMEKGTCQLAVFNALGSQVFSREIRHMGGTFNHTIYFDKALPQGVYYLSLTNNQSNYRQMFLVQ